MDAPRKKRKTQNRTIKTKFQTEVTTAKKKQQFYLEQNDYFKAESILTKVEDLWRNREKTNHEHFKALSTRLTLELERWWIWTQLFCLVRGKRNNLDLRITKKNLSLQLELLLLGTFRKPRRRRKQENRSNDLEKSKPMCISKPSSVEHQLRTGTST